MRAHFSVQLQANSEANAASSGEPVALPVESALCVNKDIVLKKLPNALGFKESPELAGLRNKIESLLKVTTAKRFKQAQGHRGEAYLRACSYIQAAQEQYFDIARRQVQLRFPQPQQVVHLQRALFGAWIKIALCYRDSRRPKAAFKLFEMIRKSAEQYQCEDIAEAILTQLETSVKGEIEAETKNRVD